MKKLAILFVGILVAIGVVLEAFTPDVLSIVVVSAMCAIAAIGAAIGIIPALLFAGGFKNGQKSIKKAKADNPGNPWTAAVQMGRFFRQKSMDKSFAQYKEKIQQQRASRQALDDIDGCFNEGTMADRTWRGLMSQIPGTMTGLGILGTFVGLVMGISSISVSTLEATLLSIEQLLEGIRVAFYTSIAGVIFSIAFNILHRTAWGIMEREMGVFVDSFHKDVIPSSEEQAKHRERREMQLVLERLDRLPKNPGYSVANMGQAASPASGNEQILMPQILNGIKNGEFVFYLQPKYDLSSGKVMGAEALVRWNHEKLGVVSPGVFVPILESNGYIAKLDQYIWEKVCAFIRKWIDSGTAVVPVSVNVTKTDIMAMDVDEAIEGLARQYKIPPRYLEVEIAENAYVQCPDAAIELEESLRSKGFRTVMDGFDGNFVPLGAVSGIQADTIKLDIRQVGGSQKTKAIGAIFEQARKFKYPMAAEGIENMEQLAQLKKNGCQEGQGYYFQKPMAEDEFLGMMQDGTSKSAKARIKEVEKDAKKSEERGERGGLLAADSGHDDMPGAGVAPAADAADTLPDAEACR